MEYQNEIWDQIIAGQTGNLSVEVDEIKNVHNRIREGKDVYLIDNDGIRIFKLGLNSEDQIIKFQL